jgi:hypothetical protein
MKGSIFWDITVCSPLKNNDVTLPATYFYAGFLLGIFFYLQGGGEMFLETSIDSQQTTLLYIAEDRTLQARPYFMGFQAIHRF